MASLNLAFRLPLSGWPGAVLETDHSYSCSRLVVDGREVVSARSRDELEGGVHGKLGGGGESVEVRLSMDGAIPNLEVWVDGRAAIAEGDLHAPPTPSAWKHAFIALLASAAGFAASYLYLREAWTLDSGWSLKMAYHMAGWHLLLTVSLFPASVWGQRIGIRSVQGVCLMFFLIHAGIAIANIASPDPASSADLPIGILNAISGMFFLAGVVYGNVAWRDMDPVAALVRGDVVGDAAVSDASGSSSARPMSLRD